MTCHASSNSNSGSSSLSSLQEGRYSFSLTTFDPQGQLKQVQYATVASNRGPPILAAYLEEQDELLLVSPQAWSPSPTLAATVNPFLLDNGTPKFQRISPSILLSHTGLQADGRAILSQAHRIAVQHAYTYNEEIPMEVFLEELSLVMQEATMKPGMRPFGCTILVGCVGQNHGSCKGGFWRVDPSGAVESALITEKKHKDGSVQLAMVGGGIHPRQVLDIPRVKSLLDKSKSDPKKQEVMQVEEGLQEACLHLLQQRRLAASRTTQNTATASISETTTRKREHKHALWIARFSRGRGLQVMPVVLPEKNMEQESIEAEAEVNAESDLGFE